MNPFAYDLAIQACRQHVDAVKSQDAELMREAYESAFAALQFEVQPVVYHIEVWKPTLAQWQIQPGTYACAFEAEAAAERTVSRNKRWRIVARTGLESPNA